MKKIKLFAMFFLSSYISLAAPCHSQDISKDELYAEAYRRGILPADKKAMYEEAVRRGLMKNPELKKALLRTAPTYQKWIDVIKTEKYTNSSSQDKIRMQSKYFNEFIRPRLSTPSDIEDAKEQFYREYPITNLEVDVEKNKTIKIYITLLAALIAGVFVFWHVFLYVLRKIVLTITIAISQGKSSKSDIDTKSNTDV